MCALYRVRLARSLAGGQNKLVHKKETSLLTGFIDCHHSLPLVVYPSLFTLVRVGERIHYNLSHARCYGGPAAKYSRSFSVFLSLPGSVSPLCPHAKLYLAIKSSFGKEEDGSGNACFSCLACDLMWAATYNSRRKIFAALSLTVQEADR